MVLSLNCHSKGEERHRAVSVEECLPVIYRCMSMHLGTLRGFEQRRSFMLSPGSEGQCFVSLHCLQHQQAKAEAKAKGLLIKIRLRCR